jgi:hypothetical protein
MAERRTLIEGMKNTPPPIERHREKEFVYGTDPSAEKQAGQVVALSAPAVQNHARSPISTRIRSDFAEALKRASLERQLAKVQPNTISDILEVALEPWLKSNGYLP